MFKWLQEQINKKKNDGSSRSHDSQSVEVATDAVVYDGDSTTEEEPAYMGGNAPSDLGKTPVLEQRKGPMTCDTERVLTTCVTDEGPQSSDGCPSKCVSPNSSVDVKNLSSNSFSSLSSMTGAEGVDTHYHCCQENPSTSSTHKSTQDTSFAQKLAGSSLSLHKHRESLSASESTFVSQKHIEDSRSPQQHQGNVSSSQKHTEYISNTQKCTASIFKASELDACFKSSNSQDFNKKPAKSVLENLKSSTAVSQDPLYSPESRCAHQRLNTVEESRKKDEEQENATFQDPKRECTSEVNVIQKSDKCVNEAALSHLQQLITSEKVSENSHSNGELLSPAAPGGSVTPAVATGPPDQVGDIVPDVQLQKDLTVKCDKGSLKVEQNAKKAVVKDKASQTQAVKYECPNPYCYPEACLYNQKGRKCTVLDEHFILTYLRESPVLVSTALQNTEIGPVGCTNVWCSGKVSEIRHIPDGTELYFDAIVSPGRTGFVALVIWQGTKPTHSVQPFYNCYVIIELMRNCPIKFVSFSKENGVVSTVNSGKTINIVFSKSIVYLNGKKIEKASEIKNLTKSTSQQLYADVLRLMTLDQAGNTAYGFMCSCIWQGCKPYQLDIPIYDPFKLYKKTPGCFPVASKQAMLLCDIDASLVVEDTTYKITFKSEGQTNIVSCNKKMLFCGNQRVVPVSGKVKVHLRKIFAKNTNTWLILMVQVPPSLSCDTTPNGTQQHHITTAADQLSPPQGTPAKKISILPQTISTKNSSKSTLLPGAAADPHQVTRWLSESDIVLKPQYTSSTCVSRKEVKSDHGQAATNSNIVLNGEHTKLLPGSPCMSELSVGSTLEEESPVGTSNVEVLVQFTVKEDLSSNSKSVISQDSQKTPLRIVKNCNGVLKNIGEAFILETQLKGKQVQIEMRKSPWIAFEDGRGQRCQVPMSDLSVGFDAHFVDIPQVGLVGHILALWTGKKPLKASFENSTYYFDAPAMYHGSNKEGCLEFTVLLEGKSLGITTTSTTALFEASGEQCTSLTPLSHVFLHLSLTQNTWTLFLVVLQPNHKTSNLTQEANRLSPKLSSTPESDTVRSLLNLQAETKTNYVSATHKTAREYGFTHYLKNLYGTLTEKGGKRVICALNKDVPLSVQVPEDCVVDIDAVATNVRKVSLETKLRFDAFCEDLDSLSYWAAIVWLKKKAQKCVAPTGCIYHLNVGGKCLNSSDKEVRFEFTLANKIEQVVCKNAYVIMPDGTFQALRSLRAGTPVHANLVQHKQNVCINNFIYVDATVQLSPTSMAAERNLEDSSVTRSVIKTMNEEKLQLPPSPSVDLLKSKNERNPENSSVTRSITKAMSEKLEPPCGSIDNTENSSVKLKSVTGDVKEAASPGPQPLTPPNEYDIAKGTISELEHDQYIFTSENGDLRINVNPMKIAVDPEASPESPLGEFYLVYHKKTKVGKCGWYRQQTHQAYLQHHMLVHSHNLDSRIITLALPDHSSLYNFLFDNEITVAASQVECRFHPLKPGKKVHAIIEDIKPVLIDGHVISHRIVLMTSVKEVAVVCLNFLNHSFFGSEEKEVLSNGSAVGVNQPKNNNEPCGDSYGIDFDGLFGLNLLEEKHKAEGSVSESSKFLITSENSVSQHQVNNLLDRHHEDNMPDVDGEGDTLRELVNTKHPMVVSKNYITRYVTLCGEIRQESSGTYVFCSGKLPFPVQVTPSIPHCDATVCESQGTKFMLARKRCAKETGLIDLEPLVVWPQERKCNPYIVVTYKVSRRKNLLLVNDAVNEEEKCYLFNYNVVFSLKNSYKLNEVLDSYSKQKKMLVLYAVVEKIPPFQNKQNLEGNILLLTTSKNVAVASIDVFIGSCHEEELSFQLPHNPVLQMLHLHKIRVDRASKCKRGSTCYYSVRESSFNSSLKSVGGCLEDHTDDFAIMRCDKRNYTAVCLLSNIYYQGETITSWKTIPKHHWKNFWAIILPLDDTVQEAKWEVDAVAFIAWCCRGPRVLALHQCYYHVQTPYVPYLGIEESQEATPTNLPQLQNSSHSSPSFTGRGMSLSELESWQCQAGNTIVAFHDSILQSCGLTKLSGKITLVDGAVVLFTSTENEVVKGKVSDIFIKGERCDSVKKIVGEIDQNFTLVAQKCFPTVYLEKFIQMEVIIGFTASLKGIGIHVCNKHACILESSFLKEEFAIAEEAFHDIAVVCEQSNQCSNYYLSKIAVLEDETPTLPETVRVMKHTLCYGIVVDIDKETPDKVRVSLQQGPDSVTLPVSRSRLMGLHGDLSLLHAVGHKLKVILNTVTGDEKEEYRILLGWGNFTKDSGMSSYSTLIPDRSCSQKSKFHCCPRGIEVKEFQNVYNSNMFEVKSLYKLKKIDVESGRGFFHYWLDEKPITCKIEFIVGWLKVDRVQEELWNLLMAKGPQSEEEYPEALAAWQGDCDSLVVEICDVHGTHGLYVPQEDKTKTENKFIPISHKRGRRNSEPTQTDLLASFQSVPHSKSRRNSEPLNVSLSVSMKLRQSDTIEEDDLILSRSLPTVSDHPLNSGLDMSKDHKKVLPSNSGSITLLSIKEDSVAEEGKMYPPLEDMEQFHHDQPLCNSLLCDEKDENFLSLESEGDSSNLIVKPKVTTITSNSFLCVDNHCGLLIDHLSQTVALVRQGNLYINKVKPKESFKLLSSINNLGIITAVVVPLASPCTLADLEVTHEAVVAWLGSRPPGVDSMAKNISMISSQPESILQEKTEGKLDWDLDKPYTSWDTTVTLKVLLRKTETIFGCVEQYADHYGILLSATGSVLFDRQLLGGTLQREAASGTQSDKENLKALALELEQPVKVLGFEIEKIAAVVWSEGSPVIDADSVAKNLNVYKMNWNVEFIGTFDQLELEEFTKDLQQNRVEDMTLADECELFKLMDECGILKVKNSETKVFFHKNVMLVNNETLTKEKWKDTLQLLMEQEQTWHCSGQQLTPQERESVKEKTGEEVQYKAESVWCTTGPSALGVQASATTVPSTALMLNTSNATSVDSDLHTTQLTEDTNSCTGTTLMESMQPSTKRVGCSSVQPAHPSTPSSWSEFLLQNKAKTKEILKDIEIFPQHTKLHSLPPHPGSLWATRPSLRINPGRQETISECTVTSYADHCGILISAGGPILFDRNLISMMQQEEAASGSAQTEQKNLKALVFDLEQPVKVLSYEVRKIAMVLWNGEKPEVDNDLLSKSLDVYKLNWIVALTCNESLLTKRFKLKQNVCRSFIPVSFSYVDTSNFHEVIYCCSQDCSVRQFRVTSCLLEVVVLEHQDDLVLAMMDDVKCSEDELEEGRHLWVISVKLVEPFNYSSFCITHFALLVYSGETEPPEAATIKLKWSRGEIEKVLPIARVISFGLGHANIRIKVDRPSEVKPFLMDPFWHLTKDKPEAGMMFAVECEVIRLIKNSGILKVKGRSLKGMEVKIYFRRTAVVVNSTRLQNTIPLAEQLSHLQDQTWRCTCVRLKPFEVESVKKTVDDDVQYKAKLVWCEVYLPEQKIQIPEEKGVTKAVTSTALTPPTTSQSGSARALTRHDQVEDMEGLCAVDRPLSTGTKPKKKPRKRKRAQDAKDNSGQEQKPSAQPSTRVGHLTEVHRTVAQVALEDEQLKYVARDKCFLYGLCLGKVELWHVLSIGLTMNYELTEDGKELKKAWLGEADLLEPAVLLDTVRDWCLINNVSSSATTVLLLEAGWLPSELTPTVAAEENVDVVEVSSPHFGSGFPGHL